MNKNIKYSQNFLTSEKVLNRNQFSNLGIYELNVIDTTTHSIKDTVSAVKEKIVSGTALLF